MINKCQREAYAPVAQLDRVFGYEPKGRGFESLPAYQKETTIFDKKVVVSFCSFHFSLFVLLSSLKLSFPEKREERKEKRKGMGCKKTVPFAARQIFH